MVAVIMLEKVITMKIEWRDIKGYEGLYKVSNLGDIYSFNKKGFLNKQNDKQGYYQVTLSKNGKLKTKRIHRIVAETFIDNEFNLPEVNHKDKNKHNNRVDNLEWCSSKYNMQYSQATKVNQFDLNGNFIKTWNCMNDIQRELGIKVQFISKVCNGKQYKTHGYIWRFNNE